MKCDARDVACAINRFADAIAHTGGITWFDWATRFVLPLLVGAGSLLVAFASLRAANASRGLAEQISMDAKLAERLQRRRELGVELVELLQAVVADFDPRGPDLEMQYKANLLRPKLGFSNEPAADDILRDTLEAFTGLIWFEDEPGGPTNRRFIRAEYGIQMWVREPDKYADWVYRREMAEDAVEEPDFD